MENPDLSLKRSLPPANPKGAPSPVSRRHLLQTSSVVAAGLGVGQPLVYNPQTPSIGPKGFRHRAYNGWITDLATAPDPRAEWPSMRLDEPLLADYRETFSLMRRLGFNEIVIWGLYVANRWPVDLKNAVPAERGRRVERLIADAHKQGIRVISGLGTYSWGFQEIIRANPKLNGGNPNAMCSSEPESHQWMRRIVDFVFTRFPIDGVSMQSADQGRCPCPRCASMDDATYHASLISRTADYIRSRWTGRILGMSNWGVSFGNPKDKTVISRMSRKLDYLIDQSYSVQGGGETYPREFIKAMACPFGTTGGLVVEPPQHWERNRWFLPTCRHVHAHLRQLAAIGGRAVEFFYHILANPSSELTFHLAGKTLADPGVALEKQLASLVEELYQPRSALVRDGLVNLFLSAEDAYFQSPDDGSCGTISLEPLVSSEPGPPVYLHDQLSPKQQMTYGESLRKLTTKFRKLQPELRSKQRASRILECLENVQADLVAVGSRSTRLST